MNTMRFQPRYSLLTLLLLTAFIAGGVKLWYGPHHVVELVLDGDSEMEFTFTRDWHGNRIVDGPVVWRYREENKLLVFFVRYYRQGIDSKWMYRSIVIERTGTNYPPSLIYKTATCPLTEWELRAFQQARDEELQKTMAAGNREEDQAEGEAPFPLFPGI